MLSNPFAARGSKAEIETGSAFAPKFDADGLIPVITADASSGDVLMFAWMNAEALALTMETGEAHYFSRSRKALWRKGETSGNSQRVMELRTDCDQDVLLMSVSMSGRDAACHVGYRSCFYRSIPVGSASSASVLRFVEDNRVFDPADVYGDQSDENREPETESS